MAEDFTYDVFLSYSSKDKAVVRDIAERLRADGLRVWFDDWEIGPATAYRRKFEEGLEHSRMLVLCMSANVFGSEWAAMESRSLRFRDPLNKKRCLISLWLDKTPIEGYLALFPWIDWTPESRGERAYAELLEACRLPARPPQSAGNIIRLPYRSKILSYAFSPDGRQALTGATDRTLRLWDLAEGLCLRVLKGHTDVVNSLAWSDDQLRVLSSADDKTVRLWDLDTESCLRVFEGHMGQVWSIAWSADQQLALSCSEDKTIRLWEVETGRCLRVLEGHRGGIWSVKWSIDQQYALSGSIDGTLRLWDVETGACLRVLEGHRGYVRSLALSPDQRLVLSGSDDRTVRLWDLDTGRCLRVLEGHTGKVESVAWSADQSRALSGSDDTTVRLWDVETGRCLCVFVGHTSRVESVAWIADQHHALSGDKNGRIWVWDLPESVIEVQATATSAPASSLAPDQVQYTNAKVLLVGESGAGKTGLSKRLALNDWQPSDSTVGAWATQWKLPLAPAKGGDGVEREIWLWDFGGQADQRLIHQLYMDETALAVLVFDGQKEDLFETLGQWDRDLTHASGQAFSKLMVAGRIDAGGLRVSRAQIEAFRKERNYLQFLETSAKTGFGCKELRQAIFNGIQWENIPWRSSPLLFKRLKEEIVRLKDEGRVLMRINELREILQRRLLENGDGAAQFTDEELKAVVGLLAGPGVVWELKFGNWVLLQPERINAYAQAVIQTMRQDEHERGCLLEERVLKGDLTYNSSMPRLEGYEERFVLLAMHQTLLERGVCLREHTEKGPLLIFPSYYRRERPELVGHPAVLVSYRFNGFLDDIYATLVVRLHHTKAFEQDELWRYAADFRTTTGRKLQLGVKLTRLAEGAGELEVYFDPAITIEEKILFSRYVHEHLLQSARDVVRLRHYVCPHCGTPVGNPSIAMKKLAQGKDDIPCINCDDPEKRVPLWDRLEDLFGSPEIKRQVYELQAQSAIVLDNESKERALVGEIVSIVALAGQICREKSISDHGIDMEVEFKDDRHEATGEMVFLQLKSGDSHLYRRMSDGAEIFTIKDERHARYWMAQQFPVLLVIRNSEGEIRWMEVRDWLRRESDNGKKLVKQIVFQGERFDVMSVRRWRDKVLG